MTSGYSFAVTLLLMGLRIRVGTFEFVQHTLEKFSVSEHMDVGGKVFVQKTEAIVTVLTRACCLASCSITLPDH